MLPLMRSALVGFHCFVATSTAQYYSTGPYSTEFQTFNASEWSLLKSCSHFDGSTGDECTQFTSDAAAFGAVSNGRGCNITSQPLVTPSSCGGKCSSGHLEWKRQISFGTFAVYARWFPDSTPSISTADGFIGLWGSGKGGGSITFIFHGKVG